MDKDKMEIIEVIEHEPYTLGGINWGSTTVIMAFPKYEKNLKPSNIHQHTKSRGDNE